MCDSCGCGDPKVVPFDVHERILAGNDRVAVSEHFTHIGQRLQEPVRRLEQHQCIGQGSDYSQRFAALGRSVA